MDEARTIADLIKRHRLAADLSQEELAARAGVSVRSISNIERAVPHRPRRDTLRLLADALGLTGEDRDAFLSTARMPTISAPAPPAASPTSPSPPAVAIPLILVPAPALPRPLPPLPTPPTSLIGREHDLAHALAALVDGTSRLLTLLGPAGVGKTHLALDLARYAAPSFAAGAVFLDLAPLHDFTLIGPSIVLRLGIRVPPGDSWKEALHAALRDEHLLLVLDNFEHLAPAAPFVADLLAACGKVVVLATSRVPLHLRGERELAVSPLPTPDLAALPPPSDLAAIPAVRLFLERVRAVNPDFVLTPTNAAAVAAICTRLDGLPLSIELAAPRLKFTSPETLAAQLGSRLSILVDGAYDLPPRQHTLRSALAWSYDLLLPYEQALFRRLAVFAGGCDASAVHAVCGHPNDLTHETQHTLVSLTDHSLLSHSEKDGDRWRLLETMREFAAECLHLAGEAPAIHRAHASYYMALVEDTIPKLRGVEQQACLAILDAEHHNIRAALRWMLDTNALDLALRMGGAIWLFWSMRGHVEEGRRWLDAVLVLAERADPVRPHDLRAPLARALHAAAALAYEQTDYAASARLNQRSLALRRALGDRQAIAHSLNNLAATLESLGDFERAAEHYAESLAIKRDLSDKPGIAATLNNLAYSRLCVGDFAAAARLYEESVERWRHLGSPYHLGKTLSNLGHAYVRLERYGVAAPLLEEGLRIRREIGENEGIAAALECLGHLATDTGHHAQALSLYRESIAYFQRDGTIANILRTLEYIGHVWCAQRRIEDAVRLLAALSVQRDLRRLPLYPVDQTAREAAFMSAHLALGVEAFDAAWRAGSVLSLEQALAAALSDPSPPPSEQSVPPATMLIPADTRARELVTVVPRVARFPAASPPPPPR